MLAMLAAALVGAGMIAGSFEGATAERDLDQRLVTLETTHFHFTYQAGRAERAIIVIARGRPRLPAGARMAAR